MQQINLTTLLLHLLMTNGSEILTEVLNRVVSNPKATA